MKHTRRVKITTKYKRTLRAPPLIRAHCPICEREVETLTAAQAADVLEIDNQMLDKLITAGRVHSVHTISGSLRICKDSLLI